MEVISRTSINEEFRETFKRNRTLDIVESKSSEADEKNEISLATKTQDKNGIIHIKLSLFLEEITMLQFIIKC